jgi:hypothetical protein
MTISALQSKLTKSNATNVSTFDYNGYNKALCFSLNGKRFQADYSEGKENIESFSTKTGYDERNQEGERIFFNNFTQVLNYSNK